MTTMIGLPLVSILMFILAGILIGHLLWYHDRKTDLRRISKLEDRYQLAKGTALKRKQEFLRLQSEVGSHQRLLDQTRADVNTAVAKQHEAEEDARVAKTRLLQFDRERGELSEKIDAETRRNESLVAQLKEALQLKTRAEQRLAEKDLSENSAEEVSATYRDRIEQLQQENLNLSENYEQEIEKLRTAIAEQAAAAAQTTRDKEGAIIRLKDELQSQQNSRQATSKSIQSIQQQVDSLSDELKAVQDDRERLSVALKQKTEELTQLQLSHEEIADENRLKFAEHQSNVERQAKLIANQQSELAKQIDLAKTNESEIIKLREQEKELRGLRQSVQQIEELKSERDSLTTQLGEITVRHEELTQDLAAKESRIVDLSKSLAEFEATQQQLAESKQQVAVIAADRQKLERSHQLISKETDSLRNQVAEYARTIETLQKQIADQDSRLHDVAAQARESAKQLALQTATATKLSNDLVAAERLRPANSEMQKRLDELNKRLIVLTEEHEDSLDSNAKAEDRIRDLQNQLHDYANKIRDQRRRLAAAGDPAAAEAPPKDDRKAA